MIFFNDESNAHKLESDLEARGQDFVRIGERTDELERRMSIAERRILQLANMIVSDSAEPETAPTSRPVTPLPGGTIPGNPGRVSQTAPAILPARPATPSSTTPTERQGQVVRELPTIGEGTGMDNPQSKPASTSEDYIPVLTPQPPEGKYPDPPAEPGEGVRYCPAAKAHGNEAEMLPCLLYGIEVDLSDAGIYFEANELVDVLRETKSQDGWQKIVNAVKTLGSSKRWEKYLQEKIAEARTARGEYQRVMEDWEQAEQELSRLEQEANRLRTPGAAYAVQQAQAEFRRCADMELKLRASRRIDITPALSGEKLDLPKGSVDLGEKPKGDPAHPAVNMVKIKIHDDILDVSSAGIWFDPGELVTFLKGVKKAGGWFSGLSKEDYQAAILDAVNELTVTVKRQQGCFEDYRGLMQSAKKHRKGSDKYKELKKQADSYYWEYAYLTEKLSEPKDLTPKLSLKDKVLRNK